MNRHHPIPFGHGFARMAGALTLLLVLAGCVETRFESLPGDQVERCDARWVGNWRFVSSEDKREAADDAVFIAIGAGCRDIRVFEKGKQDDDLTADLHFARVDRMRILAVQLIEQKDKGKAKGEWDGGYHYFRYDTRANRIDMYAVDHDRVAHLLIDGKLRGRVEMVSQRPGVHRQSHGRSQENFVAGDASAMVEVVRKPGIFEKRPSNSLIRVDSIPMSTAPAAADPSP
ncbi:MAG TPA: hypothetical protein PKO41_01775 [Dokdonella sp.]|uniref:hypothetical protein n=1 Tax=Dokdonella sp. TaxID=2291710 RepID=UPI0025C5368A|nr:hypothetical protein [Dokdonella sp.]MBX3692723.1 hypothetical protein [Dokdonella sp.]MCW5567672.1 hypothetical protein [Dokdonella sp.]HNR91130.1 hypothetical protein [Dokdonella sp.]